MGLITGRYRKIAEESLSVIERQKALLAEMEMKVSEQNQLYRSLYELLSPGMALGRDSHMKEYVREGYEGNPDLFSIVLLLAGKFAQVMDDIKLMQFNGQDEQEVEVEEISSLFEQTNYYQNFFEFCQEWAVFRYITGNSIVYAPRLTAGLNKGRLTQDGMINMPTQNVTIHTEGWRKPIGHYRLDLNETYHIAAQDIWHERYAPTLNHEAGANFMGMSPVKVAHDIINSQNKGYEITSKMYAYGHPPGILSKEAEHGDETTAEQESRFRERYRTKYQGVDNMAIPIFTLGKLAYTKIGYDNMKELEVVSMSEHGRRVFCNLLQVPSQIMNDTAASTYNNMSEAAKAVYTNRIIPDVTQFCAGLNKIISAYGNFYVKPDWSGIDVLQEDKLEKSKWISQMFKDGVITGDDYLELMGQDRTGLPEMQLRYVDANRMPVDLAGTRETEERTRSDKYYADQGLHMAM